MAVDQGMRVSCRELSAGVYGLAWSTATHTIPGGDALLVDIGRAAPRWLPIADIAVQRGLEPLDSVPPSAINASVTAVVTPSGTWAVGRRGDQRLGIALVRPGPLTAVEWLVRLYLWTVGGPSPEQSDGVRAASRDLMTSARRSSTAAYSLDAWS